MYIARDYVGMMVAPTALVRAQTYERDRYRCVSCGAIEPLEYQHRAAEGMGGRAARPLLTEGITSCAFCNAGYEGNLQALALASGWKVRRFVVEQGIAGLVPVLYAWEGQWCTLSRTGARSPISVTEAMAMMADVYGPGWSMMRMVP